MSADRAEGGPLLPEVRLNLATKADPVTGTVVSNTTCTNAKPGKSASFVRHIAIDVAGTALAGAIVPGQSFGVIPPGADAKGRPHNLRLYSVSSPTVGEDGAGNVIATTVKRVIDEHWETGRLFLGVASNYLCDLKPGDKVLVTGPSGKRFILPKDPAAHDYLFMATGTGIAPFRAMLLDLAKAGFPSRAVLIMGSPYSTDLIYHRDFLDLQAKHPNFRYYPAISREKQEDGLRPLYVQDRLAAQAAELVPLLTSPRTMIYICGLAGMELGIFRTLTALLDEESRSAYLSIDPEVRSHPEAWDRKTLQRQVRPSRRLLTEVY